MRENNPIIFLFSRGIDSTIWDKTFKNPALVRALHCSILDRQELLGALVEVNLTELWDEYIKHDVASTAFTLQESLV